MDDIKPTHTQIPTAKKLAEKIKMFMTFKKKISHQLFFLFFMTVHKGQTNNVEKGTVRF